MLLIKMLQKMFLGVVHVSLFFFQIDFIENMKGSTFNSRYVQLFSTLQELRMMSVMKADAPPSSLLNPKWVQLC